jgi:uncharacterized RDD family membrane protein YckC
VTPAGPAPVAGAQPAGVLERFLARLIDFLIFILVAIVLYVAFPTNWVVSIIWTLLAIAYYAYLESSQGATVGKKVLKMRVLGPTGGNPTMEQSLRRNSWLFLGLLSGFAVLGFLSGLAQIAACIAIAVTANSDPLKRGWHDKFAGTTVVKG